MRLHFTKQTGKMHRLEVERNDGSREVLEVPEQRILPHDMVHYGVEAVLGHRGFLTMVSEGNSLTFETVGGVSEEAVERLVEAFQSALWSGGGSPADIRYAYQTACEARGHDSLPVSDEDIATISARLEQLDRAWQALPVSMTMSLDF